MVLTVVAVLRGPEYDEAYSTFLTAGDPRPAWPAGVFHPRDVRALYAGHASLAQIVHDLRNGDVHPPLYFWALELWRHAFGPSWLAARLLSVLCAVAALAALGWLAALAEIPVVPAMLLALFTYGFAYTGIVARGFAMAQFLNVFGLACLFFAVAKSRQSYALAAGIAFGAAASANYLAIFTAFAALFWLILARPRWRFLILAVGGLLPFLLADAWFFVAQRASRTGQFAAFSWRHALPLLAKDAGATLFGGLPVYAGALAVPVTIGLLILAVLCGVAIIRAWRPPFALFALAAAAPPAGLLALGVVFHNTPIEIRYLAFATPFLASLAAAALPRPLLIALLTVQACAIVGLAIAPATMQSQGAAARAAAALATPHTLVLVPFGNDGVGIPGPFLAAAPDNLSILLIGPDQNGGKRFAFPPYAVPVGRKSAALSATLTDDPEIILAKTTGDDASRAAIAQAEAYFAANPCWQPAQQSALLALYLNRCAHQQP